MQRRRRGQDNSSTPIKSYEGSFTHAENKHSKYGFPYIEQYSTDDSSADMQTQVFRGYQPTIEQETAIWYPENQKGKTPISQEYAQPGAAFYPEQNYVEESYNYEEYYDDYSSEDSEYYDDYDLEDDEEYQAELKRDRWKLVYFFINLFGAVFGLMLIFLLISVVYNMVAWVLSDLIKIFSFLGVR